MKVRSVKSIPERQYPFELSKATKKWIDFLNELPEGETIEVSVPQELSKEDREKRLRVIRDRLKSASKRAQGDYEFCRRNNAYYVKRLSEQEKNFPNNIGKTSNDTNTGFRELPEKVGVGARGITQKTPQETEEDKGYYEERKEYL